MTLQKSTKSTPLRWTSTEYWQCCVTWHRDCTNILVEIGYQMWWSRMTTFFLPKIRGCSRIIKLKWIIGILFTREIWISSCRLYCQIFLGWRMIFIRKLSNIFIKHQFYNWQKWLKMKMTIYKIESLTIWLNLGNWKTG